MNDPYETLDVEKDATADDIRRSFRDKCMRHHPDHGGDIDEWHELKGAYLILSNGRRRKEFDTTGKVEAELSLEGKAQEYICKKFADKLLNLGPDIFHTDVIELIGLGIHRRRMKIAEERENTVASDIHIEKVMSKLFRRTVDSIPFIEVAINSAIRGNKNILLTLDEESEMLDHALKLLEEYEFETEEPEEEIEQHVSGWRRRLC